MSGSMVVRIASRDQLVDLVALLLLSLAALAGLATTYTGAGFLVVGGVGVLLGVLIAHVTTALRWPVISAAVIAMLVFYLLGGPLCLRSDGASALAPGPSTVRALTYQVLFGWKDLLTTLPPVDGSSPLLVLPWMLGLLAGVLGGVLALRTRPAALPLLAPVLLLVTVILLGVGQPQSLLLQGAGFAVLALGWLSIRARRATEPVKGQSGRVSRLVLGAGLLGLAGGCAVPAAHLAFDDDAGDRVVLRTYVEPPFDIGQYPSPLSAFRRYVKDPDAASESGSTNVYDKAMFTVTGAPAGARLRIAALDSYDGVVWGAANDAIPGSSTDTFQRVSSTIANPVEGSPVDATVTIDEGYTGVWLPTFGALQSMDFETGDTTAKAESFRYNLASATAVVPSGMNPGDIYAFHAVLPDDTVTADDASSGIVTAAYDAGGFLDTQATQWTAGESDPMKRVFAAADHLRIEGKYSDGVTESEKIYHAGHNIQRLLDEFVNYPIMAGDDEQYAAVMALLANRIGVPARVVLGAVLPEGGVVKGKDISAWVELQVADGSWRTLPTSAFMDDDKPADLPPQQEQQMSGVNVPPPAAIAPPSSVGEQTDAELHSRKGRRDSDGGLGDLPAWLRAILLYVGLPVLVLLLVGCAIAGAKAWRRRRRRSAERVSTRVIGAWRELVDHARDLGEDVPMERGRTRREQAAYLSSGAARPLAERADALVFGPNPPEAADADGFWSAVDSQRASMTAQVGRRRRLAALVNLTTFRRRPRASARVSGRTIRRPMPRFVARHSD
jgi:hypothetical protein